MVVVVGQMLGRLAAQKKGRHEDGDGCGIGGLHRCGFGGVLRGGHGCWRWGPSHTSGQKEHPCRQRQEGGPHS